MKDSFSISYFLPQKIPNHLSADFFMAVKEQLEKDFTFFNEEIEVTDISSEEIVSFLSKTLERLMAENPDTLKNILYRIDLSEVKTKQEISLSDAKNHYELLARQIIEREAKKVYFKWVYSGRISPPSSS
jgi:hypothetical protein